MQRSPCATSAVSLRRLAPKAEFHGTDDILVTRCCANSQDVVRGDVFVALPGTHDDGHNYVQQAIRNGASAVVAQRNFEAIGVPVCVVKNCAKVFGRLCQALVGNPSKRVKTIGVTGSNGKTTTTFLIASILEHAGCRPGVMGTLGYCDRREMHPATHTTPPADVLASWLARMEANACTHAVLEVSSHALSQYRVEGIRFDAACVTNLQRDHLDFHGSMDQYRDAKGRLFRYLSPEGVAVLNADDAGSIAYLPKLEGPTLTVGIDESSEVSATVVNSRLGEQTFLLEAGQETVPVRTSLMGRHNVYNCLMAAAVGLGYGINLPTIARGLEDVRVIPGRLERVDCGQPFKVFVDYAHTPDALTAVLSCLREITKGRLICVFGAGGDRDREKRPLMGKAVAAKADLAVVTSDNPRSEDPRSIITQIAGGFRYQWQHEVIVDRAEAIRWALSEARPDDCVLVAGKGHEDYQIVGNDRLPFDDRLVVRCVLREDLKHRRSTHQAA